LTVPLLDKLKIDDVVGAIPVHLVAGIFGTMIVPLTNSDASYFGQFVGVVSVGVFVSLVSAVIWFALKATIGLRVSEEVEHSGLDQAEIGVPSYGGALFSSCAPPDSLSPRALLDPSSANTSPAYIYM